MNDILNITGSLIFLVGLGGSVFGLLWAIASLAGI